MDVHKFISGKKRTFNEFKTLDDECSSDLNVESKKESSDSANNGSNDSASSSDADDETDSDDNEDDETTNEESSSNNDFSFKKAYFFDMLNDENFNNFEDVTWYVIVNQYIFNVLILTDVNYNINNHR